MTQVCHFSGESIKGGQYVAAPLASDFCKSDHLQLLFHIFGLSMLSNAVKETAVTMALNIGKKHGVSTNWPNIATNFARRSTLRSLLLLNWSSWRRAASATQWTEFESKGQSSTSPGETRARLPTGLRPHRHLWCHCQSTWTAEKGTVGHTNPCGSRNPPKTSPLWGGRPDYHLGSAKCQVYGKLRKS